MSEQIDLHVFKAITIGGFRGGARGDIAPPSWHPLRIQKTQCIDIRMH